MYYHPFVRRLLLVSVLTVFFLIPLLRSQAEAQSINAGGGVSIFVPGMYSDPSRFSVSPAYRLLVEKPELFYLSRDSNLVLTPGMSFFHVSRSEGPGNALGGGGTLELKHWSLSPYLKVTWSKTYKPETIFRWYYGVIAGVHLYTKTKGEHSWWMMQQDGYITGKETIDTDARDFFNLLYMGIVTGFTPKVGENPVVKPAFEVTFSPSFINITDSPVSTYAEEGLKNVVMFSVILGF